MCFEQALESFNHISMRLESARTSQSYGIALLEQYIPGESNYTKGLKYLQDANQTFRECNANLDLQAVERLLAKYKPHSVGTTKK